MREKNHNPMLKFSCICLPFITMAPMEARFRRPIILTGIAWFYLALPILNLAHLMLKFQVFSTEALNYYPLPGVILMLIAPVVGAGLLRVKRWAYYLFIVHATALIVYNTYMAGKYSSDPYYTMALARSVPALLVLWYFFRREISAPYLSVIPRGWRRETRVPVVAGVWLNGDRYLTHDLSPGGCYINGLQSSLSVGQALELELDLPDQRFALKGIVVRTDSDNYGASNAGVKFIKLSKEGKRAILRMISDYLPVRYKITADVELLRPDGIKGKSQNLSERGFFLQTAAAIRDTIYDARITLNGYSYEGKVKTAWINEKGKYFDKPAGAGFSIIEMDQGRRFKGTIRRLARKAEVTR